MRKIYLTGLDKERICLKISGSFNMLQSVNFTGTEISIEKDIKKFRVRESPQEILKILNNAEVEKDKKIKKKK